MQTIDLRKELKSLYNPSAKQAELVTVPAMNFLMLDGEGDPNSAPTYMEAIEALYSVSYTLKFMLKKRAEEPIDYPVMALEGLWWADNIANLTFEELQGKRDAWQWTMMIMQPPFITDALVAEAMTAAAKKKELPALGKLRLELLDEGLCAQIMHIGPYAEEGSTVERLHAFARENGYALHSKHHEIYLGDPRRTAPEKLKTILRHPVTKP